MHMRLFILMYFDACFRSIGFVIYDKDGWIAGRDTQFAQTRGKLPLQSC